MKPRIKLAYCDLWPTFDPRENYFTQLLAKRFEVVLSDDPDYLIYGCYGRRHRSFNCVRIFYAGENWRPNFGRCDFAFTFDHCDDPRHFRFPAYALYGDPQNLVKAGKDPRETLAQKTTFCNFVYSNPFCPTRNRFFRLLSKYKPVASGGRLYNNIGGRVGDKPAFIRQSKFTIAFENDSYPGYTTEKLSEPMHAESLPIYWGNPLVHLDFNPRSFVNVHDWPSLEAVIEHIIAVDRDDELYCEYVSQPWYHGNRINDYVNPEKMLAQFERIFLDPPRPAALARRAARVFQFDRLPDIRRSIERRIKRTARKLSYRFERAAG
jgi:alpha(1,3/1,4) fucosyltransferase